MKLEQYGQLAKLVESPLVDRVGFSNLGEEMVEIDIRVYGHSEALRVLNELTIILPNFEIQQESQWNCDGQLLPCYHCDDGDARIISVAEMLNIETYTEIPKPNVVEFRRRANAKCIERK